MKKFIGFLVLLLAGSFAPLATAQTASTPFSSPEYYASSYNLWSINSQAANSYTFAGRSICTSSAQGQNFFVFNTNAPVLIADANSANSEIVTPSAIINTVGSCGVTIAPANLHYNFQLKSGTAGLQEAIDNLGGVQAYPAVIVLDRNWYSDANALPGTDAAAVIAAAKGNYGAVLENITSASPVYYVWNGTAYASGTWTNTAPTAAAGTAAGTGPTISNAGTSTATVGTVNLTAGTATTTGTLFTETWPTTGSFANAGSCTVASSGSNSFTAFTVATSYGSSARTLTVTATGAPTASTAYSFTYQCK